MEAFTLLSHWKGGGGGGGGGAAAISSRRSPTTILTSVSENDAGEDDADNGADDEGSFFDLELSVPEEDHELNRKVSGEEEEEPSGGYFNGKEVGGDDGGLSCSCDGEDRAGDLNIAFCPSEDPLVKGRLVAVEPPSSNAEEHSTAAKALVAQLPASFLKSAAKFRVFMLGLKKSKLNNHAKTEKSEAISGSVDGGEEQQKKTLMVKLKAEELPINSVFTRDDSSRSSSTSSASSSSSCSKKRNDNEPSTVSDEKGLVMMHKYLKKVKPLYIRVSRRYGEKLSFSNHKSSGAGGPMKAIAAGAEVPAKIQSPASMKTINIPAGLKGVKKHLGKSKSSSTAENSRRDDSLIQQQDGIQSAILHCKRSFNSSRDGESTAVLPRSVSDPSSYDI